MSVRTSSLGGRTYSMGGRIVIGIDEAGYGPSMGPLVIGGTAWWIPDRWTIDELTQELATCFQPKPSFPGHDFLSIGDSKKILVGKYGWPSLSLAAEWLLAATSGDVATGSGLSKLIAMDWERLQSVPWFHDLVRGQWNSNHSYLNDKMDSAAGPLARQSILATLGPRISQQLDRVGMKLLGVQARCIDEPEFNRMVTKTGNKSTVLSELSLQIAKSLAESCLESSSVNLPGKDLLGVEPDCGNARCIEMFFDKHGGRNRYQAIVIDALDGAWVQADCEGPKLSSYRTQWRGCEVALSFRVGGDSLLPSGAASIIAKWVRELSMASLNSYWESACGKEIRPTAGYYVDACRFAGEIEAVATQLGIDRSQWWRIK